MSVANFVSPYITIYKNSYNNIFKSNNNYTDLLNQEGAGYAIQNGVANDQKNIIRIWR
jgi:hypothetical protein